MEGRTTFVIAHRLSTIALADEIVVLEDGRDRRARHARRAARATPSCTARSPRRACPTRSFLTRERPGARGGGPVSAASRAQRLRSRSRRLSGASAARKLRQLLALLRPYRGRVIADVHRAGARDGGGARSRPTSPAARSTTASRGGDPGALTLIVVAVHRRARCVNWGATYVQTYLVSWVGQRALQDLRLRLFAHLQRLSIGFYSRNKAGVLISRLTNDVQALDQLVTDGIVTLFSAHADADRHGRDPAPARRRARAGHVPDASRCWLVGSVAVPDRLGRRLPR